MFIFVMSVCAIIVVSVMIGTRHFFSSLIMSAMHGIVALFAVNLIGDFLSVHIALNLFSLMTGVFGGLPGVIFLLVNNLI